MQRPILLPDGLTVEVQEPVGAHPDVLDNLTNEEYERFGALVQLVRESGYPLWYAERQALAILSLRREYVETRNGPR